MMSHTICLFRTPSPSVKVSLIPFYSGSQKMQTPSPACMMFSKAIWITILPGLLWRSTELCKHSFVCSVKHFFPVSMGVSPAYRNRSKIWVSVQIVENLPFYKTSITLYLSYCCLLKSPLICWMSTSLSTTLFHLIF